MKQIVLKDGSTFPVEAATNTLLKFPIKVLSDVEQLKLRLTNYNLSEYKLYIDDVVIQTFSDKKLVEYPIQIDSGSVTFTLETIPAYQKNIDDLMQQVSDLQAMLIQVTMKNL